MIECSNLKVKRGEFFLDVDFTVDKGSLLTLLGPSGSGKSTILHSIAGFIKPDSGDIRIDGKSIIDMPPNKRHTSMVFQDYALFPHMSVEENIAYGLKNKNSMQYSNDEITKRVSDLLNILHISQYGTSHIDEISGGEQQRVALARAIANYPQLLLLDEPLGALDLALRTRLRKEIREVQQAQNLTAIYVTHDQIEAFAISDIIGVISQGRIVQLDTPQNLYYNPLNAFVAKFLGGGLLLPVRVQEVHAERNGATRFLLDSSIGTLIHSRTNHVIYKHLPENLHEQNLKKNEEYIFCMRPEHVQIVEGTNTKSQENVFLAQVIDIEFQGSQSLLQVKIGDVSIPLLLRSIQDTTSYTIGESVRVYLPETQGVLLAE